MPYLICSCCGTEAPLGAIFCDNCGYDLRTVVPAVENLVHHNISLDNAELSPIICQHCHFENAADSIFCENCGSKLTINQPVPKDADAEDASGFLAQSSAESEKFENIQEKAPDSEPKVVSDQSPVDDQAMKGRLEIQNLSVSIPIPQGLQSVIIGRDDPSGGIFVDINLEPYGAHEAGVGRRHAQLYLKDEELLIEDLESVNGTYLNREILPPKRPKRLRNGDELRLGRMILIYMID